MIIIHQTRRGITNLGACKTVQLNGRFIDAHYLDGTKKILGVYDNDERAAEVFEELLENAFPEKASIQNDLVFHSEYRNTDVYYLPEE